MLTLRKSQDRGHADHGWLKTQHSFSFAHYYDPRHMGWGNLRVINEDFIAAGTGFGTHPHADMEIVTYVLRGALAHRDSMGNHSVIHAGEVQRMSAGSGVRHSEFSAEQRDATHLLQIWVEPNVRGIAPEYEQKLFDAALKSGQWCPIATPDGRAESLRWHADASLCAATFGADQTLRTALNPARKAYVHLVRGRLTVNGVALHAGDAVLLEAEPELCCTDAQDAEALWFDLAP